MTRIQWIYYPKSRRPPELATQIIGVFEVVHPHISSSMFDLPSNSVLACLRTDLEGLGFSVETGKTRENKIQVPVLFGLNGQLEKSFDADAYHRDEGFVIEVEAGRGVVNYQFLKDFF